MLHLSYCSLLIHNLYRTVFQDELYTFWPKEENSVVVYGKLKLKLLSEECLGDLMVRRIDLREDTPYHIPVCIVHCLSDIKFNVHCHGFDLLNHHTSLYYSY